MYNHIAPEHFLIKQEGAEAKVVLGSCGRISTPPGCLVVASSHTGRGSMIASTPCGELGTMQPLVTRSHSKQLDTPWLPCSWVSYNRLLERLCAMW